MTSRPLRPTTRAGAYETLMLGAAHPDLRTSRSLTSKSTRRSIPTTTPTARTGTSRRTLWGVFGADPRGIDLGRSSELLESTAEWIGGSRQH